MKNLTYLMLNIYKKYFIPTFNIYYFDIFNGTCHKTFMSTFHLEN